MLTATQRDSLEETTQTYASHLPQALAYLDSRGISERTARTYRLGYVPPNHSLPGDEQYEGRMAIPFITTGGVVCVRYRSIDHSEPKYLTRAGDESTLFSVTSLLDDTDTMVITEGEIDAMTLNQVGISAVGVSGAKAWKRHYRLLFEDYERVIVACDGDAAGRDFGRQVTDQIQGAIAISMPDGEDVNSVYTTHGEESVRAMLRLI